MPDFNTAFAELQAAMQDLNGDGIPDPVASQEPVNAMAGMREPMSPGMAAVELVRNRAPQEVQNFFSQLPANAAMMAAGPVLGAAGRAAMAFPKAAAGILGATGLLTSTTEAGSPQLTRKQQRQMEMERMRIQAEADARRQEIEAETQAAASRGEAEARIAGDRQRKEAELAEYERQVKLAEHARDTELSRERRFSDTAVGKTMDAMGGLAPVAAGLAAGAISRGATGPGGMVKNYLLPGALGAAGGFTAANAPLGYDAFYTDADNPEKAAYQAYSRELPPTHPRKQEFGNYAASLSDKNPVREQAGREFLDDMPKRALMSGIEGLGGGLVGADAVRLMGRGVNAFAGLGGRAEPAAPVVLRTKAKNGQVQFRNEAGEYVSPPNKKP
jgi:hypothetical protein